MDIENDLPDFDFVDFGENFEEAMEAVEELSEDFKPGQKLTGTVTKVSSSGVFVDINAKSEGIIPSAEFLEDGEFTIQPGDEVTAFFLYEQGGEICLTLRMSGQALLDSMAEAYEAGIPVEGKVMDERKGGFSVKVGQNIAFCPYSQIDRYRADDASQHIGQVYYFLITKLTHDNFVVSRRQLLDREASENIGKLQNTLHEGDIVKGKVRKIESFG